MYIFNFNKKNLSIINQLIFTLNLINNENSCFMFNSVKYNKLNLDYP